MCAYFCSLLSGSMLPSLAHGSLMPQVISVRPLSTLNTLTAQDIYNAKQATSAIREIYQILIKVDRLCDDLLYDINNAKRLSLDDAIRKIRAIKSTADRIKELIPLDLPTLKPDLKNYSSALENYWNRVVASRYGNKGKIMQNEELRKKAVEAKKAYKLNFETLKGKLEELMGKLVDCQNNAWDDHPF
jgi:hypothetical protein